MEHQRIHSRRSRAVKWTLLLLLIVYIAYPSSSISSVAAQHAERDFGINEATADIGQAHRTNGAVNTAKLLIHPLHPRGLIPRGHGHDFDECLKSDSERNCMDKLNTILTTRRQPPRDPIPEESESTLEDCLRYLDSSICSGFFKRDLTIRRQASCSDNSEADGSHNWGCNEPAMHPEKNGPSPHLATAWSRQNHSLRDTESLDHISHWVDSQSQLPPSNELPSECSDYYCSIRPQGAGCHGAKTIALPDKAADAIEYASSLSETVEEIANDRTYPPQPGSIPPEDTDNLCESWPSHSSCPGAKAASVPDQSETIAVGSEFRPRYNSDRAPDDQCTCAKAVSAPDQSADAVADAHILSRGGRRDFGLKQTQASWCPYCAGEKATHVSHETVDQVTIPQMLPRKDLVHRCKLKPKCPNCSPNCPPAKAASVPDRVLDEEASSRDLLLDYQIQRHWCLKMPHVGGFCSRAESNAKPVPEHTVDQAASPRVIPRRARVHRCELRPQDPWCQRPSGGNAGSMSDHAENSAAGPAILPRKNTCSRADKRVTAKRIIGYPRYQPETLKAVERSSFLHWSRSAANLTIDCANRKSSNSTTPTIKERMDDTCIRKSPIFRTWIDVWLPPKECEPFHGNERHRCVEVSEQQSPITIAVYAILGISAACAVALLIMTLLRLKRRRMAPMLTDSKRSSGSSTPRFDGETRSIGGDGLIVDRLVRRGSDRERQESGVHTSTTLDGATDGWAHWILKKRASEQGPGRRSPTPRSKPPRIPSLNLPKPTFATMRKASGLSPDPESVSREKSRASKKPKAGPKVKWDSTL